MLSALIAKLDEVRVDAGRLERSLKAAVDDLKVLEGSMPARPNLRENVSLFLRDAFETPWQVTEQNKVELMRTGGHPNEDPRPFKELFQSIWDLWAKHCKSEGISTGTPQALGRQLRKSFQRKRSNGKVVYLGLRSRLDGRRP
jgi:hypothetical protein